MDKTVIEMEFKALKAEQFARIGYRDNMVYMALTAVGVVSAFALSEVSHRTSLLVLPWLVTILGWMYVVNDQKVSAIGRYIRTDLSQRLRGTGGCTFDPVFGWELAHRDDSRRVQRKVIQFAIDELTFCGPGVLSLLFYKGAVPVIPCNVAILMVIELVVLAVLAWQIFQAADFKRGV